MKIECLTSGSYFTNSYVISNDLNECIIIDCGLRYEKCSEYIKSKYNVKAILLTHMHSDHIDGLQYFKGIDLYISKYEYPYLFNNEVSLYNAMGLFRPFNENDFKIHTLYDNDNISLIGLSINCIHTPGHTEGSMSYIIDNNIFSGDTLFYQSIGRIDFPTGSYSSMLESLDKLSKYPGDYNVYPGHGDKTTIAREVKYNPYMRR